MDIVQDLYKSDDDLKLQIEKFAKEKAIIGKGRENYEITKTHLNTDILAILNGANQQHMASPVIQRKFQK